MPTVSTVPSAFSTWPTSGISLTVTVAFGGVPAGARRPRPTRVPFSTAEIVLETAAICGSVGSIAVPLMSKPVPRSVMPYSNASGVTPSTTRPTRRPSLSAPSAAPAAGAALEFGSSRSAMTRSMSVAAFAAARGRAGVSSGDS